MTKPEYKHPTSIEEACAECQPIVNKFVRKYARNHYWLRDDLEQRAWEGVCRAWKNYKPSSNNKFSTYAYPWIFALVKDHAVERWNELNAESEFCFNKHDTDYYDLDTNSIDIERQCNKLSDKHHAVFELRMAGFTFDQIASELGLSNLQRARNIYREAEKAFA